MKTSGQCSLTNIFPRKDNIINVSGKCTCLRSRYTNIRYTNIYIDYLIWFKYRLHCIYTFLSPLTLYWSKRSECDNQSNLGRQQFLVFWFEQSVCAQWSNLGRPLFFVNNSFFFLPAKTKIPEGVVLGF